MLRTRATRSRMDAVQTPIIDAIGSLVREVPGTISLGQGMVHWGPPPGALEAARSAALAPASHRYQAGAGMPDLIDRITLKLREENGIAADGATWVMVTAGSNMAFMHAILAITSPGDEVILPTPFYFNHEMAVQMVGCHVVRVPTGEDHQLDVAALRRAVTFRTRAIVTISPNNPTGAVYGEASLAEVSDLCRTRGLYHVSDEAYEYFTYGGVRHVSPASLPRASPHTISLFSLSKAFGFAGWRIGYMTFPEELAGALMKSQDTILICPPIVTQAAASAALAEGRGYCEPLVQQLDEVRGLVLGALGRLGDRCVVPPAQGAFYCLVRIAAEVDTVVLAERIIREHGVAVVSGLAFGAQHGACLRLAFGALERETVEEGMGRLVDGLSRLLPVITSP
jgi:aspartate/methionine/tyrosine aminotransferase